MLVEEGGILASPVLGKLLKSLEAALVEGGILVPMGLPLTMTEPGPQASDALGVQEGGIFCPAPPCTWEASKALHATLADRQILKDHQNAKSFSCFGQEVAFSMIKCLFTVQMQRSN